VALRRAQSGTALIRSGIDIFPPLSVTLLSDSPLVILNHGLTGGSHESYVRNMVLNIAAPWAQGGLGGRVAVVNVGGSIERVADL